MRGLLLALALVSCAQAVWSSDDNKLTTGVNKCHLRAGLWSTGNRLLKTVPVKGYSTKTGILQKNIIVDFFIFYISIVDRECTPSLFSFRKFASIEPNGGGYGQKFVTINFRVRKNKNYDFDVYLYRAPYLG